MWLPDALPDESFYSRIIRSITVTGVTEEKFLQVNFGKRRVSIHPYLTIGVASLPINSIKEKNDVIAHQTLATLFGYYLPKRAGSILDAIFSNDGMTALRACNLASFKETEPLAAKYCPACSRENIYYHGVSYWHISHQIPGVESCGIHKVRLECEELPVRTYLRSSFLPPYDTIAEPSSEVMFKFAKYVNNFVFGDEILREHFDLTAIRSKLMKADYILPSGNVRNAKLTSDLLSLAKRLKLSDGMIEPLINGARNYVYHLLRGQFSQHPFRYLLISFLLSMQKKTSSKNKVKVEKVVIAPSDCLSMLKKGVPIIQIHKETGRSRTFIKQLALVHKIPITKKPRSINDAIVKAALVLAHRGFHRGYIAHELGISTGSVELIISCETGLVEKRKQGRFESRRRRNRIAILRCMQSNPMALKQEIKKECYAPFHWLYRNDKTWLDETLPNPQKAKFRYVINWGKRDQELAKKVKEFLRSSNKPISLTSLDKQIGGHGWLLKSRNKLPLTMTVYKSYQS